VKDISLSLDVKNVVLEHTRRQDAFHFAKRAQLRKISLQFKENINIRTFFKNEETVKYEIVELITTKIEESDIGRIKDREDPS